MMTKTHKHASVHSQSGAKPICRLQDRGNGKRGLSFSTPESVIYIDSTKELEAALHFYGRTPFIKQIMPTTHMRRFYVEEIRPALRWYCKHFGNDVPSWLIGTPWERMPPEEQADLFGPQPLKVTEFERREPLPTPEAGTSAKE